MILYCAADLLWATKIKSTADALKIPCRPVRSLEMLEARLVDSPVRAVLIDLEAQPIAGQIIDRLRGGTPAGQIGSIRLLAFGPHVAVDQLRAAKAAGVETVMARGALHARLAIILQDLASSDGPTHADAFED